MDGPAGRTNSEAGRLWRSIEETIGQPPETATRALPSGQPDGHDRRSVLKLMAASAGLAGLAACSPPREDQAVPAAHDHEGRGPNERQSYATSITLAGYGRGVIASCLAGRPLKLDGNPRHPTTAGGSDPFLQAEILTLYDPVRSGMVREAGRRSGLDRLDQALAAERARLEAAGGEGLAIVTEPITSPLLAGVIENVQTRFPGARWYAPDPLGPSAAAEGARAAFGRALDTVPLPAEADVILDLDADLLGAGPSQPALARGFAAGRDPDRGLGMSRLYALGSCPGLTSAAADQRAALQPAEIEHVLRALLYRLDLGPEVPVPDIAWFDGLVEDLLAAHGRALVLAGRHGSAYVHAATHALNWHLGAVGRTVRLIEPVHAGPGAGGGYEALAADLDAGDIETLLVLGANPAYHAPGDLGLPALIARPRFTLHQGVHDDETAVLCRWHVPQAHELESWGDARAHDGTLGLRQPLIRPLKGGITPEALLAMLLGESPQDDYDRLRAFWQARSDGDATFDAAWRDGLRNGVVEGTASAEQAVEPRDDWRDAPGLAAEAGRGLVAVFRPDPTIWDGRFATNAWLQELPKPLTTLTWDNAALIAPATALRLGLASGDVVRIGNGEAVIEAPVWVMPGHAVDCVTLPLGHGRSHAGPVATDRGFDANRLRRGDSPWHRGDIAIEATGRRHRLAATQQHHRLDGLEIVRHASLAEHRVDTGALGDGDEPPPSLYPDKERPGHAWGMVIDLGACIGCNACVTACQAENNTAVVGKDEVLRGRELHWLRIDRYHAGPPDDPDTHLQPVLCMQCDQAPCEVVCPVNATVHSSEGLNDMVYNRCIGTRTCSNNCPYKVRRFNWHGYARGEHARPSAANNPDVTVRARGVMEKCTYCTHRISAARIAASREGRAVADGEVATACQDACPTRAITFGDLRDLESAVARRRASPRNYALLGRLGTRPRTTYLAKITNPRDGEG